ncbi:MAG: U32 family peptidase [Rhizobacter sp.]|nr:U32 family peptidase [Rhizobacter sp.]
MDTPDHVARRLQLTVGPVQYYWTRSTLTQFYADVADSPADTVVLGETVCSRRHEMKLDDWLALAHDLRSAGKQVMLATQALVESESDLRVIRRLQGQRDFLVEAEDASALAILADRQPFALGPHINIYNRPALDEHAAFGAVRWCAPLELSLDAIAAINPPADPVLADSGEPVVTEVFAFGRMPLALSARCFTARHHRLSKDQCEFRCGEDADGLLLSSSEGQPFLVLNGTQTMSAAQQCLILEREALRAAGVASLRLSPCSHGFIEVISCFDRVMNHGGDAQAALQQLRALSLPGGLANGFAHRQPGLSWVAP